MPTILPRRPAPVSIPPRQRGTSSATRLLGEPIAEIVTGPWDGKATCAPPGLDQLVGPSEMRPEVGDSRVRTHASDKQSRGPTLLWPSYPCRLFHQPNRLPRISKYDPSSRRDSDTANHARRPPESDRPRATAWGVLARGSQRWRSGKRARIACRVRPRWPWQEVRSAARRDGGRLDCERCSAAPPAIHIVATAN